jgi:hypothetical protein
MLAVKYPLWRKSTTPLQGYHVRITKLCLKMHFPNDDASGKLGSE